MSYTYNGKKKSNLEISVAALLIYTCTGEKVLNHQILTVCHKSTAEVEGAILPVSQSREAQVAL